MKTIDTLGLNFVDRHHFIFDNLADCGVAICGGCAAAIAKGKEDYEPADIDLVATQEGALQLIGLIQRFLINKKSNHFRIYVNSHNDFVPKPAVAHFRITCSYWVPICIFVLPPEKFRYYRIEGGYMLQLHQDVKQAANELSRIDGKKRLANEEIGLSESEETEPDDSFRDAFSFEPQDREKAFIEVPVEITKFICDNSLNPDKAFINYKPSK